jgi:hypothetical protein
MSDLSTKLAQAKHRDQYLAELRHFLRSRVGSLELLSIDETTKTLDASKNRNRAVGSKLRIPFYEKSSPRFRTFINQLASLVECPVYLCLPLARVCGLPPVAPLVDINFDFDFDASPDGILVVITADLGDKLLLDYSEDDGARWVDVEVSGERWSKARY